MMRMETGRARLADVGRGRRGGVGGEAAEHPRAEVLDLAGKILLLGQFPLPPLIMAARHPGSQSCKQPVIEMMMNPKHPEYVPSR